MRTVCTLQKVGYAATADVLHALRQTVFVQGQGIDPALEADSDDVSAVHVLAVDAQGQPVGTARLTTDGRIGRMAVLESHRRQGIAQAMLDWLVAQARSLGLGEVRLHAQLGALPLYATSGFLPAGEDLLEAGRVHRPMRRRLDGAMEVSSALAMQYALASVIACTGRQLALVSPALDPGLLDEPLVFAALRKLATRHQLRQIRLLVDDPLRIQRQGGPVLALVQRMPSVFELRQRDLDQTERADALAFNDRGYWLHRNDAATPGGRAGLCWRPGARRLHEQFEQQWASSQPCPQLRPLTL